MTSFIKSEVYDVFHRNQRRAEPQSWATNTTRSSAIAEGPRDASCQLKSCQLPRNSAETTCTASPEQIEFIKLESYTGSLCNKHVHSTVPRSSPFYCPVGVVNKPTTVELWISPVYRRLPVAKFSKSTIQKLLTWPWPRPLREHSLITRLRLRMANPCTKLEVSSVSRCGDFYMGCKIIKRVNWLWPRPFRKIFFIGRVGFAMVSQCTKFEVSNYTHYEDMRSCAKCTNWGSWERLWITQGHGQCHHSIERIRHPIRL